MALDEGIEELFGEEKTGAGAERGVAAADAVALTVAMDAAKYDPELARKAGNYLGEQHVLVKLQIKHFDEEHRLAIAAAKRKRFADRIRNTISAGVLLIVLLALLGFAWMLSDAVSSRQVVIAPFDIGPGLATRDVSGKIVAAGVLDELIRLQAATRSSTQKTKLANAWEGEIKIEVPQTGLSIGEITRALRERFGHDIQIDGDLMETPAQGLALTVRGSGVAPKTFTGNSTQLEKLTQDASEYIYGQSRPALWAAYLTTNGRYAEAIAFARTAIGRADFIERARLLDMWSDAVVLNGGSIDEGLSLARAAVKVNPDDWGAHADIQYWLFDLGDQEGSWQAGEKMKQLAGGRPGRAPEIQYFNWDQMTWDISAALSEILADLDSTAGEGTNFGAQWAFVPVFKAQLHDPDAAELALRTAAYDESDELNRASRHWANAILADERGNAALAAQEWEQAVGSFANAALSTTVPNLPCYAAAAFERAGRHAEAGQALDLVGKRRFVDCYRFRADILDGRGNWAGAQKAYAEAVALAPDLPAGYYSWGVALAKHGDLNAAAAKFAAANQRGPHWADPLKDWGDVFAKQGETKKALAKYDEALRYAPNWAALKKNRTTAENATC
jgi:tetratricopeptide (TPR) repeat protein